MPGVVALALLLPCAVGRMGHSFYELLGTTHLKRPTIYTFLFCLIVSSFSSFDCAYMNRSPFFLNSFIRAS